MRKLLSWPVVHLRHEGRNAYVYNHHSLCHPHVLHADYRAGGKLAPSLPKSSAENVQGQLQAAGADGLQDPKSSEDMEAAARVLRNVVEGKGKGKAKLGGNATDVGSNLSTSFWADLLD